MLTFEPVSISHKPLFLSYAEQTDDRVTEQSFAALYAWAPKYKTEICHSGGFLFTRSMAPRMAFWMPMGRGDLAGALRGMEETARAQAMPFMLRGLTRDMRRRVEEAAPHRYVFTENPEQYDYLYARRDLEELAGKKYHAKRNFITRFENEYAGRWRYEDITKENLGDVWVFQDKWCRKNDCASNLTLQEESTAIALFLYNLDALGAMGGLLRLDGSVVAFTVGSPIGRDTVDINIEKADYDVVGSYPMINWAFVRNRCSSYAFVNREEDMGLPGLRKAKLSYHPREIIVKYTASLA